VAALVPPVLIKAPPPPNRPYGLFDVAMGPMEMPVPEAQGGGVLYVPDTCVDDVFMYAINCPPVSGSKTFSTIDTAVSGAPFAVITSYTCGTIGWTFEEVEQRVRTRMSLHEQRAVERRVWQGWNASNGLGTQAGLFSSATDLGANGCVTEALADLEQALANNGVVGGMIHARPYMAPHLSSAHLIEQRGNRCYTKLGTPVVFGQGYDGSAPGGSPPASGATAEAMYASGRVLIWGSETVVPPLRETMDRSFNQQYALAERVFVALVECGVWYTTVTRDCTTAGSA
jgi:hypothetical protein